jgi:CheY-like chemotaxis protein
VIQLRDVIQDVLDTLSPLLAASRTSATFEEIEGLPPVFVKLPMLQQALLNIASVVIQCTPGGQLRVRAHHQGQRLFVDFQAAPASEATASVQATFGETLEMAGQLLAFCQGSLRANVPGVGKPASAEALLPAAAAVTVEVEIEAVEVFTVLVIEDNDDTRQLLQRYLYGTPYLFVGAPDAQQALVLAQKILPRAIVLDVMMPGQDGWTLLGQLREHPSLRGVPIIVSTILPQKELAFALGAAEFIRKPIKRSELLAALARHLGSQTESESSR